MFSKGFPEDVRQQVFRAQRGYCKHCPAPMTEVHHMLHNTEVARHMCPLFLNSIFNAVGLCHKCHDSSVISEYRISVYQAEVYEQWLMEFLEGGKREWEKGKESKESHSKAVGGDGGERVQTTGSAKSGVSKGKKNDKRRRV